MHAVLAYREHAAQTRGVTRPNLIKPETAHPPSTRPATLGVELRKALSSTPGGRRLGGRHIDDQTVAIVGSACNYG